MRMRALGWWLMLVGSLRLASVWFGFFDIWALRVAVFSKSTSNPTISLSICFDNPMHWLFSLVIIYHICLFVTYLIWHGNTRVLNDLRYLIYSKVGVIDPNKVDPKLLSSSTNQTCCFCWDFTADRNELK